MEVARYYRDGGKGYRHTRNVTVGGKFGDEIAAEYGVGKVAMFEVVPESSLREGYSLIYHHLSLTPEADELVRYLLADCGCLIFPEELWIQDYFGDVFAFRS